MIVKSSEFPQQNICATLGKMLRDQQRNLAINFVSLHGG